MKVSAAWSKSNKEGRKSSKDIHRSSTETQNGGSQELRFGIIKDLGHVYPHGGEKHNDIVIAEVFWEFFNSKLITSDRLFSTPGLQESSR